MEKQLLIDVKGMHCASCSSRIEKVLSGMEGVKKASVNLAAETLDITFNENKTDFATLRKKVTELGFELVAKETSNKGELELNISGMHCASCSSRIEKVVSALPGVISASVNLASETGKFRFDSTVCNSRIIREAVHGLGFTTEKRGDQSTDFEKREREIRENLKGMKKNLLFMFAFAVPLLLLSMGEMMGMPLPDLIASHDSPVAFSVLQLLLTIPIMWLGRSFYSIGFSSLIRRSPNMDSLIALGTGAAFVYSVWNLVDILLGIDPHLKVMDLYFESVGVLITLVSLGKYMETASKSHTSDAIRRLMQLSPKTATLLHGLDQKIIDVEEIEVDDILLVKPGERIPVDGEIVKGESAVDESMMTGESLPIMKKSGEKIYGGTLNGAGVLQMRALHTGENTMLARIMRMVQEAQGSKAGIARIADRVSLYFVPIVMVIALLTGVSWLFFSDVGFSQSLRFFISVLVIACPCAMGLATPISIMVGAGRGAQLGVLVKNGETFERSEKITTIIFDKTGTITRGKPEVTDFINCSDAITDDKLLQLIASAEQSSEHPLADAVVRFASQKGSALQTTDSFASVPGQGITATVDGTAVSIGNGEFMEHLAIDYGNYEKDLNDLSSTGKTVLFAAVENRLSAIVAIADTIKPEVKEVVQKLKRKKLEIVMLTGDNRTTAEAIAKEAGIDTVIAQVLPDRKAEIVKKYQDKGRRVAMVGDGINDAPALARADVGIAMGTGIDIAIESGDIVIMKGNLDGVVTALSLSTAVMRNIRQNLFWAFAYNVIGIPIAAGLLFLFGGPTLNPMFAGAAMAMSSVSVVGNALRLRYFYK